MTCGHVGARLLSGTVGAGLLSQAAEMVSFLVFHPYKEFWVLVASDLAGKVL